jgi:hypothetical protein
VDSLAPPRVGADPLIVIPHISTLQVRPQCALGLCVSVATQTPCPAFSRDLRNDISLICLEDPFPSMQPPPKPVPLTLS